MYLGVAVLDPKSSGKIGLYAICYYMITTILAAILGKANYYSTKISILLSLQNNFVT